jgi:hypothetical protein
MRWDAVTSTSIQRWRWYKVQSIMQATGRMCSWEEERRVGSRGRGEQYGMGNLSIQELGETATKKKVGPQDCRAWRVAESRVRNTLQNGTRMR